VKSIEVKIRKIDPKAVIPKYAQIGDAGCDLVAVSRGILNNKLVLGTGLAMEIPEGYVGLIFPRSSVFKYNARLSNSVGVIDSKYRGEIKVIFDITGDELYNIGDRVGQIIIIPYPQVTFQEASELSSSERGMGGFGSTGS